jgi:D-citramalate synthase
LKSIFITRTVERHDTLPRIRSLPDEITDARKYKEVHAPYTLGILNPEQTYEFCRAMAITYPSLHFDFHAHNDYDLAVANVFSALRAGIKGVHTTVNGLGERAGNAPLSSVVAVIKDHLGFDTNIDEGNITKISRWWNLTAAYAFP